MEKGCDKSCNKGRSSPFRHGTRDAHRSQTAIGPLATEILSDHRPTAVARPPGINRRGAKHAEKSLQDKISASFAPLRFYSDYLRYETPRNPSPRKERPASRARANAPRTPLPGFSWKLATILLTPSDVSDT